MGIRKIIGRLFLEKTNNSAIEVEMGLTTIDEPAQTHLKESIRGK